MKFLALALFLAGSAPAFAGTTPLPPPCDERPARTTVHTPKPPAPAPCPLAR